MMIIQARALQKIYGEQCVVDRIDFDTPASTCMGILGPNGAGKTTTIRMILGLSPITSGSLSVFGLPLSSTAPLSGVKPSTSNAPSPRSALAIRRRTGVVPQLDSLDPDFTVSENLEVYARYFGITRRAFRPRKQQLLTFANLASRAGQRIQSLSGGMQRRLSIARALVNDPELLVLDEPTTGLDPQARHLIWARLGALKRQGKTMLLTTHYMEEAERLCDHLLIMDNGRIVAHGSPQALITAHVEPHVFEMHTASDALDAVEAALSGVGSGSSVSVASMNSPPHVASPRLETVGDTLYVYAHDSASVAARLCTVPGLAWRQRPATLEDVFLRLTGRQLRD